MASHGKVLPAKLLPVWCPLCIGQQVLPGACSNTGCSQSHSLLWAYICTSVGLSRVCRWIFAPLWTSMGCRSTACLATVFTTSFREICSNTWSTSSPSIPTDPGVCRAASLACSHSSLLWLQLLLSSNFLALLRYVFPLPLSLMSSVLASGMAWRWPALALSDMGEAPTCRC